MLHCWKKMYNQRVLNNRYSLTIFRFVLIMQDRIRNFVLKLMEYIPTWRQVWSQNEAQENGE